jgi:hypothetical protein
MFCCQRHALQISAPLSATIQTAQELTDTAAGYLRLATHLHRIQHDDQAYLRFPRQSLILFTPRIV